MSAERDALIEQVVSAHRPPDPRGGLAPLAAFHDLTEGEREQAFNEAIAQRALEAAVDPHGQSVAVRRVLARIRGEGEAGR